MTAQFNPTAVRTLREAGLNLREFWQRIREGEDDFTLLALSHPEAEEQDLFPEYRFIDARYIDYIMDEELEGDDYLLGCFNADFLAEVCNLPENVFRILQRAYAYEDIGKLVKAVSSIEKLRAEYVAADGYGHHFAPYDHKETELIINSETCYYMFRVH